MAKFNFLSKVSKTTWIEILIGLSCTVLILIAEELNVPLISPYIQQIDHQIYDKVVSLNLKNYQPQPKVVIVDIDEYSIEQEGRWPWPRDKMARLINILKQGGIVSFGIDIVMPEAETNYAIGLKQKIKNLNSSVPLRPIEELDLLTSLDKLAPQFDNDQIFAQSLLDHNVVLGFLFDNSPTASVGALPQPIPYTIDNSMQLSDLQLFRFLGYVGSLNLFIKSSTKGGFVTNYPDPDGVIRRTLLLGVYKDGLYPSLALGTAMNYLLVDKVQLITKHGKLYGFNLDGTFVPTTENGQALIPFWGGPHTLDYFSATDILQGKIDPREYQGAVAIIGSTITLLADLHQSPAGPSFPGVEMVGNIVQAIINQRMPTLYDWHTIEGFFLFISVGLILTFLLPALNVIFKLLVSIISLAGILGTSYYIFGIYNLYIPTAFLLVLITLQALLNFAYSFIMERLQKRKISQLFGQYVPEDYVKELIDDPNKYTMEGQTRDMTVLFSDIRSFTSISETLDAAKVKRMLNTFFTPITEIIFTYRGTIDKYVGDMVVAFWGAPIEDKDHAYHAILTSLTIFKRLPEINANMVASDLPSVNIGVGLSTGLMNVGDMGSEFRRAYTVLGDIVNLGSRLQDLTKFYHVNVLVSDSTQQGQEAFIWRPIDKVSVKGRKTATTIYEPVCTKEEATPSLLSEIAEYKLALEQYYARNWVEAEKKFATLKNAYPNIYVYQMYLARTEEFKKNPPEEGWEGVHVHLSK